MIDPDNGQTSYAHDNANRLTSLTNPFNETTALQYDAAGRPVRQNNANGIYERACQGQLRVFSSVVDRPPVRSSSKDSLGGRTGRAEG